MLSTRQLSMLIAVAFAAESQAATLAVTAPINNQTDPKTVLALHQLMASELDFQDGVESVTDLEEMPASLNNSCLSSTACLKGITASAGTEQLVTGAVSTQGDTLALDLLLFDSAANKVIRRKTWNLPNDTTEVANQMTPILKELLTGEAQGGGGGGGAVAGAAFSGGGEDDFAFDEGGGGGAAAGPTGDPEVDDLMDIDSLEDLDEEEERGAAGAVVAGAAAGAAVGAGAAAASEATGGALSDDDVLSMISFGGGGPAPAAAAATGAANTAVNSGVAQAQGAATSAIDNAVAQTPKTGNAAADAAIGGAAAAAAKAAKGMIDLEAKKTRDPVDMGADKLNLAVRGGVSKYYEFDFVTGGAELGVALGPLPLDVVVGLEVYAVQRTLPPEVQVETAQIFEWNTIFPMNLGLLYRMEFGQIRPYVGADGIMVQYYRDEIGGDWAGGARARFGGDYYITPNFGVNLNFAAGGWLGQNWPLIEPGVGAAGVLPQASAGVVIAI